ncbi:hypothetical protein VMT65_08560 [Nocardia sp. CDC153]|uniref:hypothetical protein n=1 Tax=Nocardia sp. CDC153 TaxID=3112167 RepID=UPI002DB82E31|nr:hypothetical protein [Nocardia sp. CDC153]MEC3953078.1 hypothetical protein [Nocardia sp. CDC153]
MPLVISSILAAAGIAGTTVGFLLYSGERQSLSDERATSDHLRGQLAAATAATAGSAEARRSAAEKAGCDYVNLMATYDVSNLDGWLAAVLKGSTGSWHQTLVQTGDEMLHTMRLGNNSGKAVETHCGVASLDDRSAHLVAVTKQAVTNPSKPDGSAQVMPMLVTIDEQSDGRWLVSEMTGVTP